MRAQKDIDESHNPHSDDCLMTNFMTYNLFAFPSYIATAHDLHSGYYKISEAQGYTETTDA